MNLTSIHQNSNKFMLKTRAKFKVDLIQQLSQGGEYREKIHLSPVIAADVPLNEENARYHTLTPSGSMEIMVTNTDLHGKFKVGQYFYVDLTEVK